MGRRAAAHDGHRTGHRASATPARQPQFPVGDHWIHFDSSPKRCTAVADEVVRLVVHQAEPWWREQLELRSQG
ncbi:hypothetical protein [Nocardioides alpinus]|uniref:Uncharacterized protein n=1 Tax=Nocardioides alpinus TaxID=748909 RepID=A0ABX4QS37_9ACTN|nr:hypothetical protein [Nocardioides alpinus]PKH37453.1 hypothetical protein CXG46_18565 [Nocardioides alpinus]